MFVHIGNGENILMLSKEMKNIYYSMYTYKVRYAVLILCYLWELMLQNIFIWYTSVSPGPSEGLKIRGGWPVLSGGHNLPPLVEIGLTDLPKFGGFWHPQGRQACWCIGTIHKRRRQFFRIFNIPSPMSKVF